MFLEIYWSGGALQVNLACRLQVEDLANGEALHWSHVTCVTGLRTEVAPDFQEIFGIGKSLSVMLDVMYEGLGRPNVLIRFVIVMSWQSSGQKFVSLTKL